MPLVDAVEGGLDSNMGMRAPDQEVVEGSISVALPTVAMGASLSVQHTKRERRGVQALMGAI